MTKTIFMFICLAFAFFCLAESRTISMYDLEPATLIKSSSKKLGGPPIFHNCSKATDTFELTRVAVGGCTAPPCPLIKGKNVSVEIDFIARVATSQIKSEVYGQIAGVKVPFPISNDDACSSCNVKCPTVVGQSYAYKYSLEVKEEYPSMTLAVFWYFEGPNGEELCMDVAAQIKSA
ncbi:NPC intracellular cholesterol transporter 2 homolog a-like [Lytechinus variegatus]|uniref:NPC intracellular cholesterol transporter 2 homolog a-like n=1 Tax=Lytechinus variegatus TaxID=7654 RepID=UPI001BB29D00|nr:NPC intracellular cholesterol transporter 2 homolog a-like [Lytechinus variegatus]